MDDIGLFIGKYYREPRNLGKMTENLCYLAISQRIYLAKSLASNIWEEFGDDGNSVKYT